MSKATASLIACREENYEYLLSWCPVDQSCCIPKRDEEGTLLRFAAVEWHENGTYWICLFADIKGCLSYFFSTDGGWLPHVIFDLQTQATYSVDVSCKVGRMTSLG